MSIKGFGLVAGLLVGILGSHSAHAYTQCELKVKSVWADANGVWLDFTNSTGVGISITNPARESLLSMAMTALLSSRTVVVRYQADNVSCDVSRNDFLGMYLY